MPERRMVMRLPLAFLVCAAVVWLAAACGGAPEPCRGAPNQQISVLEEGKMTKPHATPTDERIHEVRLKYDPLFWRQPNVHAVGEGYFKDGEGGWTETVGIVIEVSRKVDQSTLPPEDRIPECLEGVPVQVVKSPRLQFTPDGRGVEYEEEGNGSD